MILKRYSVVEEGFWEYRIYDDEVEGCLDDYCFEDEECALKACKKLNGQLTEKSIYRRNEIKAKTMKIADKIKICINLPDVITSLCFEIDRNALMLENFILNCKGCELSEIEIDSKNLIKGITIMEAWINL